MPNAHPVQIDAFILKNLNLPITNPVLRHRVRIYQRIGLPVGTSGGAQDYLASPETSGSLATLMTPALIPVP